MRESKRKKQNEEFLSQHLSISHHSLATAILIRLLFLNLLSLHLHLPPLLQSLSSHLMPFLIISHYSYSNRSRTSRTSSYSISSLNPVVPSSCTISSFKYSYFLFFSFFSASHRLVLAIFHLSLAPPVSSPAFFLPPCHYRHIIYEVLRMFLSAVLLCNQGYQHVNQYQ